MRVGARSPAVARGRSRPDRRGAADQREGVLAGRAGLRDGRIGVTLRYVRGLSASRQTSTRAITPRQGGSLKFGRRLGEGCPLDTARSGFRQVRRDADEAPHLEGAAGGSIWAGRTRIDEVQAQCRARRRHRARCGAGIRPGPCATRGVCSRRPCQARQGVLAPAEVSAEAACSIREATAAGCEI
jgi:hypothetical protein